MNPEIKSKCYEILLNEPSITQKEIAKRLGLSEPTVSRAINSVTKAPEYQLALKTFGSFIQEASRIEDFFKLKISELSNENPETLEERMAVIKLQSELYKDVFQLIKSQQVLQAIQLFRDRVAELGNKA